MTTFKFSTFKVLPVRWEQRIFSGGGDVEVCDPDNADFWTVYGCTPTETEALVDCLDEDSGTIVLDLLNHIQASGLCAHATFFNTGAGQNIPGRPAAPDAG